MEVWLARTILEQQLQEQAAIPHNWDACSGVQLDWLARLCQPPNSDLGRVGQVAETSWAMSHRCLGDQKYPFDRNLVLMLINNFN